MKTKNLRIMKKLLMLLFAAATMTFVACSSSDDNPDPGPDPVADFDGDGVADDIDNCPGTANTNQADADSDGIGDVCDPTPNGTDLEEGSTIVVSEDVSSDTTWESKYIYNLDGRIRVSPGATLTIEAGTLIKANAGTGTNASVLIVSRGSTLVADGTATDPIIFTSVADNIEYGSTAGTNLGPNDRGLWGGLIILGSAPVSLAGDATEGQIEGIPASDTSGLYGGDDPEDGDGTIVRYVSIRHGGALIGEGNEINGLTLGGVGSGAVIDHVEVVANVDDGVEFFGGTVSPSNLFVWAQGDDGLDIDQAYSGTITNSMVVLGDASDHALEIDGPEGSLEGSFTLDGITLVGNSTTSGGEYADYRSNPMGATNNIYAYGFPAGKDIELDNNAVTANYNNGILTFSNWEVVGAGSEIFAQKVGCAMNCDDEDPDNDVPEVPIASTFETDAAGWTTTVTAGAQTVGADTSEFAWTYANAKAELGF